MIKILFICLGNICRSPMAEMIFTDMVKKAGLEKHFEIASAATSTEETGNGIYPPARSELNRRGIPVLPHRARQMTRADYEHYDLLIGMEKWNLTAMHRIAGEDEKGKIRMLGEWSNGRDIADPWYTDCFDIAYDDIHAGCEGLLAELGKTLREG
ncbi:MAG: hypothetical protein CW338_02265 [Clostridiales bacterium]|nr:hypothetical protein [Clostridiales bacterium]